MWRNYRLALSFANLVYFRAWADLIPLRSQGLFTRKSMPGFGLYFALAGDVLALSLAIFFSLSFMLSAGPRFSAWVRRIWPVIAILMLALALRFLSAHLPPFVPRLIPALLFGLAALLALGFPSAAGRAMKGLALAATPCLAVTVLAPLYYLSVSSPLPPDPPLATRLSGLPPVRVVWMVFDDWDQRLTFGGPYGGPPFKVGLSSMPVITPLVNRSFTASRALAAQARATPVYDMSTAFAIPSLLYGKVVTGFEAESPSVLRLVFAGSGESAVFGSGDSIFSRVRTMGWNSAIAGWFLPYCRVFASQVSDCFWDERFDQSSSASHKPLQAALDETRMLLESDMYSPFGRALVTERHFQEYQSIVATARRYAADPAIALAFIHLNVPHMPYFDNPGIGQMFRPGPHDDLYLRDLPWVDRAIGEVLSSLAKSGLDAKTAVVLSSDHPARLVSTLTPYVPFIVHLPNQTAGITLSKEVSALKSADLILAIARGDVRTPADISAFLLK